MVSSEWTEKSGCMICTVPTQSKIILLVNEVK